MDTTTEELVRAGQDTKERASDLVTSVRSTASLARRAAREQLAERPYTVLGIAAGAGFVLAGGVAPVLMRGLMSAGSKLALGALLDEVLDAVLEERAPAPAASPAPAAEDEGAEEDEEDEGALTDVAASP